MQEITCDKCGFVFYLDNPRIQGTTLGTATSYLIDTGTIPREQFYADSELPKFLSCPYCGSKQCFSVRDVGKEKV